VAVAIPRPTSRIHDYSQIGRKKEKEMLASLMAGKKSDAMTKDNMPAEQGADLDDEELLDEALIETFPASDPPSNTVVTGIGPPPPQ
jgi:hypothetical protein